MEPSDAQPATAREAAEAASIALSSEWIAEEADFRFAMRKTPGSSLQAVRMPLVLFLIGSGFAGHPASPVILLVVTALATVWGVAMLMVRNAMMKKIGTLPDAQRTNRVATDGKTLTLRILGLEAAHPIATVKRVKLLAEGVLLDVRGSTLFVPSRALAGSPEEWRAFFGKIAPRAFSVDIAVTVAFWSLAGAFAAYKRFG